MKDMNLMIIKEKRIFSTHKIISEINKTINCDILYQAQKIQKCCQDKTNTTKIGMIVENKDLSKLKFSKNVNNKNVPLELYFWMKKSQKQLNNFYRGD